MVVPSPPIGAVRGKGSRGPGKRIFFGRMRRFAGPGKRSGGKRPLSPPAPAPPPSFDKRGGAGVWRIERVVELCLLFLFFPSTSLTPAPKERPSSPLFPPHPCSSGRCRRFSPSRRQGLAPSLLIRVGGGRAFCRVRSSAGSPGRGSPPPRRTSPDARQHGPPPSCPSRCRSRSRSCGSPCP